jgi:hypothetical protein
MGHSADIELIQNQLREKEQLVAALTERLEQAAEQLDRMRRTGADKGRRPLGGGGLPTELVDEHKSTLEDLKRVIARWEDIQAGAALGRIETQIVELRDLVVSGGVVSGGVASGGGISGGISSNAGVSAGLAQATPGASNPTAAPARPAEAVANRPSGKAGGNAWWEAQKAAMLGEPVSAAVQAELAQQSPAAASHEPTGQTGESTGGSTGGSTGSFDLAGFNIPDLPAPVNIEELSPEEAHAAIRQRDELIAQLREPLLLWKTAGQLPAGFRSIAEIPEPLKQCIADLEAQWQAKFRQVELDLSLERARLARDQSAVRQQQEAFQKQSRNGGSVSKADSDPGDKDEDGSSKRRWFRFMGTPADGGQPQGAEQKK